MGVSGRHRFTSESVTEGHPDKVADQVSDAVLDSILEVDPEARVACETLLTTGLCLIAGEITTKAQPDFARVARRTIAEIGYTDASYGFDAGSCSVVLALDRQSADIAMGVDTGGAGDQGMMFGYACRETEELMPLPITLAHRLVQRLSECRRKGIVDFFRPDGKSQVTVEYEGDRPVRVHTIVVSTQHAKNVTQQQVRDAVEAEVIARVIPDELRDARTTVHVNPTGRFEVGGPHGDTGLTGRKIIVDTYGGMGHHGGGAFSGKDPTKVDRSASYMARHIAKNLVAAGLADRVEVQLAYAIGVAEPVSVRVDTFGTGRAPSDRLAELVRDNFPLTPRGIIDHLNLRKPIYRLTAAFGHFGRNEPSFGWESTSVAKTLQTAKV
jgi:S-adenosylmethionine synthetase